MKITEPMTMLTDYALAAFALFWGIKLCFFGRRNQQNVQVVWGIGFLATASASLCGGTFHGFKIYFNDLFAGILWRASLYSISLASFFMLTAIIFVCIKSAWRTSVFELVILKFLFFAIWMISHSEFRFAVYDYASAMIAILLLQSYAWINRRAKSAPWIISGVVLGLAAGVIQMTNFNIAQFFNHNDLFHVMQMTAFYLFFRGGKLLRSV